MLRSFALPAVLCASPVFAQTGEIVVTGSGPSRHAGEAVYSTITLDRERLTGAASGRLEEILRDVPGFQLFRRSDSRSANPTSQGATLRALGGNASSRALLILDGVPQTDPFGGWISWPAYRPERLGSARVTRGGGSGVDGSGALAGAIELASATPGDLRGTTGAISVGSRESLDVFAGIGADLGAGFLSVSAAVARGDGFIPIVAADRGPVDRPARYDQSSLALRGIAPVGTVTELQVSGLVFRDRRERGLLFSSNRTTGADASLRLVGAGKLPWSALAYLQTRDYYNSFAATDDARTAASRVAEQYSVPSTGLGARAELRPRIGRIELRVGGDWRETIGETRERFNFQNGAGTRLRAAGGRTRTVGGFIEAAWQSAGWTLTGGGRLDRWRIAKGFLEEKVIATGTALTDLGFPDRSGWQPTGRAGLAWQASETLKLRGAAYLGWRLPTLNELYRPFRVGPDATAANAALAPERLRGIEAGAVWTPAAGVQVGATVFANRLGNAIANVTLARGPGVFPGVGFVPAAGAFSQRRNLDAVDARGIEIDGQVARGPWSLAGGYSFVDASVRGSGPALPLDSLRPAQTPRHSLAATLSWRGHAGGRASFSARYAGSQYEDDLNRDLIPDGLSFDAAAELPVARGLAIEARAENITDARIIAGIAGDGVTERATPRTLWIGLNWRGS